MDRRILVILTVLAIALAVMAVSIEAQRGGGRGGMGGGGGGGGAAPMPTEAPPSNNGNYDNGGNTDNGGNIGNVGNFPPTTAPVAPYRFYIEVGESRQFTYWGHDIAVSYLSASPTQVVTVTLDGNEKLIEVDTTFTGGIYWEEGGLDFSLTPVVWKVNDEGRLIPYFGGTWNTTELRFEAQGSWALPPGNY